ncbi:hypothetical protein KTT_52140 [Tengunoibacter tsumagoiensis]|uniref:Zinc finger Ogr/Delta-type domain-containing protein n=1 Tax=Tengunoibacter tsumagoiensis TaxID=2014871 RepID=A0A402A8P6_9CHLR|nr:hypothetical protein KTT_52140 [Tengunoibacter tsumagoiensis]
MNCPTCNQPMDTSLDDSIVRNHKTGQEYDKQWYVCKSDDIWVTVESPRNKAEEKEALLQA